MLASIGLGVLTAASLVDFLLLPSQERVSVERVFEPNISLGVANDVSLIIRNRSGSLTRLILKDEPPIGIESDFRDLSLTLESGKSLTTSYQLTPHSRGDFVFGDLWI